MKKISDIKNPYLQKNAVIADSKENGGNKNGYIDNNEILLFSSLSMDMLIKRSILAEYQEVIGIEFDSPEISSEIEKLKAQLKKLNYSVSNIKSSRLQLIATKADLLRNGGNGNNKLDYDEALFFVKEALPYLDDDKNLKELKAILNIPSDEEIMARINKQKCESLLKIEGYKVRGKIRGSKAGDTGKSVAAATGGLLGMGLGLAALSLL